MMHGPVNIKDIETLNTDAASSDKTTVAIYQSTVWHIAELKTKLLVLFEEICHSAEW